MDCSNDNVMWDLQAEDYCLEDITSFDETNSVWNGARQNGEDFSYMLDETTPVKACGDLAYNATHGEYAKKEVESIRETSSQVKRRRMLQYDTEVSDILPCNEDMSSAFFKPKEGEDSFEEALFDVSQWVSGFAEDASGSGLEGLDQPAEGWLADCFGDTEMHFSSDDMNLSSSSDVQIDTTEICNTPPQHEASTVQEHPNRARRNVVFKGSKSYMRTPTKLASSVVYPFAFIKPCGVHGDVTLKDINQRIRIPPPSKSKQSNADPSSSYPTSALTGKPVVGKTKIRTDGGKGSITIMRTKG